MHLFHVDLLVSDDRMEEWYWRPWRDHPDICRRPMEEEEQEAGEVLVGGCGDDGQAREAGQQAEAVLRVYTKLQQELGRRGLQE